MNFDIIEGLTDEQIINLFDQGVDEDDLSWCLCYTTRSGCSLRNTWGYSEARCRITDQSSNGSRCRAFCNAFGCDNESSSSSSLFTYDANHGGYYSRYHNAPCTYHF